MARLPEAAKERFYRGNFEESMGPVLGWDRAAARTRPVLLVDGVRVGVL